MHFIDNDSASACLVKGYAPTVDSCELVGQYWIRAAALKMSVYIDRVESKSNIADAPSRNAVPPGLTRSDEIPPQTRSLLGGGVVNVRKWFQADSQILQRGAGTCPVYGGQSAPSPEFQ